MKFLERVSEHHPHQLQGLRNAVSFPSGVSGGVPATQRFSYILGALVTFSAIIIYTLSNTLCTQFSHKMGDYPSSDLQMGIDPAYDFGSDAYADDMKKTKTHLLDQVMLKFHRRSLQATKMP